MQAWISRNTMHVIRISSDLTVIESLLYSLSFETKEFLISAGCLYAKGCSIWPSDSGLPYIIYHFVVRKQHLLLNTMTSCLLIQSGTATPICSLLIDNGISYITCSNFFSDATSHQKNKSNSYVVIIMYSVTTLLKGSTQKVYTNSRFLICK